METTEPNLFVTIAVGLGSLVLVAIVFLSVGEWLKRAFPSVFPSPVWAAIHALALVSALAGALLVWAASQQPSRPPLRDLLLPLILPGVVYGGIAFMWLKGLLASLVFRILSWAFRTVEDVPAASSHENGERDDS